jgi:hypothetical protein
LPSAIARECRAPIAACHGGEVARRARAVNDGLVTPVELRDLREKYEEMLRLRLAADAGATEDPRRAMAALASKFPGALREIDDLPLDAIRDRIAALASAEAGGPVTPWMAVIHDFHALTRGALCAKKWLAGRKQIEPGERETFVREAGALCFGEDALAWADDLSSLASPPRGRITELVYRRMAAVRAVDAAEVRRLVFPFGNGEAADPRS